MAEIKIISSPVSLSEIKTMAEKQFGPFVKAVVDIEKEVMAVGGDMNADEEAFLIVKIPHRKIYEI